MTGREGRWDRMGIVASVACTIHCLIAPLLFLFLPRFASVWAHPASHALVALFVLPMAAAAIRCGYRKHGRKWVVGAAVVGVGFILAGSVLPYIDKGEASADEAVEAAAETDAPACTSCCPQIVEEEETGEQKLVLPPASIATVLGSLFLITSHIGNLFACRCCIPSS